MPGEKQKIWLQYTSLGMQLLTSIALSTYVGLWLDKKQWVSFPLFVWLLPIVVIVGGMYQLIKVLNKND
ncbi:MAG: AtpZ/AtpI family protein [Chitinophagaceae bacterium]